MPASADDDGVVHGNAERGGDIDDRCGHLAVASRDRLRPEADTDLLEANIGRE